MVARTHHGQTAEDGDRPTRTPEPARATTRPVAGRDRGRRARARVVRRARPGCRPADPARRIRDGPGLRVRLAGRVLGPRSLGPAVRRPFPVGIAVTLAIGLPVPNSDAPADAHPDADARRSRPLAHEGDHAGGHGHVLRPGLRPRCRDEPVRRTRAGLAGETAAQILAAYFEGSKPATTDPTQIVRVLLLAGYPAVSTAPLSIHGRGGPWSIDGVAGAFPAGGSVRAWRTTTKVDGAATTTWRIKVLAADGRTQLHAGKVTTAFIVRPAASATRLQLDAKPASSDTYRGSFKVVLGASSARVVDRLGLDNYLRGVVPVEMPASWPVEALRAQAVAARELRAPAPPPGHRHLRRLRRHALAGLPGGRGREGEDEPDRRRRARGHPQVGQAGRERVLPLDGWRRHREQRVRVRRHVWRRDPSPVKYLRGIADRAANGTAFDAAAPYYHWSTTSLTRAQVSAVFRKDPRTNVGDVTRLDLTHRGVSGRLYKVTLIGSAGSKTVSADVFASVYNAGRPAGASPIRSNLFDAAPVR